MAIDPTGFLGGGGIPDQTFSVNADTSGAVKNLDNMAKGMSLAEVAAGKLGSGIGRTIGVVANVSKGFKSMTKEINQLASSTQSGVNGIRGMTEAIGSMAKSIPFVGGAIASLSSSFGLMAMSSIDLEKKAMMLQTRFAQFGSFTGDATFQLNSFASELGITRKATAELMEQLMNGMVIPDAEKAQDILKSLGNLVGNDTELMKQMSSVVGNLSGKYVGIETVIADFGNGVAGAKEKLEQYRMEMIRAGDTTSAMDLGSIISGADKSSNSLRAMLKDFEGINSLLEMIQVMAGTAFERVYRAIGKMLVNLEESQGFFTNIGEAAVSIITSVEPLITGIGSMTGFASQIAKEVAYIYGTVNYVANILLGEFMEFIAGLGEKVTTIGAGFLKWSVGAKSFADVVPGIIEFVLTQATNLNNYIFDSLVEIVRLIYAIGKPVENAISGFINVYNVINDVFVGIQMISKKIKEFGVTGRVAVGLITGGLSEVPTILSTLTDQINKAMNGWKDKGPDKLAKLDQAFFSEEGMEKTLNNINGMRDKVNGALVKAKDGIKKYKDTVESTKAKALRGTGTNKKDRQEKSTPLSDEQRAAKSQVLLQRNLVELEKQRNSVMEQYNTQIDQSVAIGTKYSDMQKDASMIISQSRQEVSMRNKILDLEVRNLETQRQQLADMENQRRGMVDGSDEALALDARILAARGQLSNKEGKISEQRSKILKASKDILEVFRKQNEILEKRKSIASLEVDKMNMLVDMADNYAQGLGASAEMRYAAIGAMEKQLSVLDQQIELSKQELELAPNSMDVQEKLKKQEMERLGIIKGMADKAKVFRDAWVSAMGAMTTGQGRLSKFMVTQEKSLGQSVEHLRTVRSYMSGAVGKGGERVGYKGSERFTAGAGGQMNIQGASASKGSAYQVGYGPNQEVLRKAQQLMQSGDTEGARKMLSNEYKRLAELQRRRGGKLIGGEGIPGMVAAQMKNMSGGGGGRGTTGPTTPSGGPVASAGGPKPAGKEGYGAPVTITVYANNRAEIVKAIDETLSQRLT
jgi:hypothetical protein